MPELTPEERERIYLEEKARIEARQQIEAEQASAESDRQADDAHARHLANVETYQKKQGSPIATLLFLCGLAFMAYVAFVILGTMHGSSSPKPDLEYSGVSNAPVPDPQVDDVKQKLALLYEKDKVQVVAGWNWYTNGDYDYVKGSVKNKSSHAVSYWKATVQFKSKKGEIIDSAYTNALETLPPGASKRFEIMHSHVPGAKSAVASVEEVQFGN
jgi:hypothetical protein